jgi:Ca2+-binding EF-hand superfamily protein
MKIPHQMLWSAVGGFALATGAYAGGGSGQAEVKMMDTDGDGSISAAEHAAGAKKMFEMMDADGDGIVTAKEMEAAHKDMPTAQRGSSGESDTQDASRLKGNSMHHDKSAATKIKMIDTDGDGTISAAEHEAGAKKMFEKMDKDHDGKLSAAEVQAGHDRMMTAEDQ